MKFYYVSKYSLQKNRIVQYSNINSGWIKIYQEDTGAKYEMSQKSKAAYFIRFLHAIKFKL